MTEAKMDARAEAWEDYCSAWAACLNAHTDGDELRMEAVTKALDNTVQGYAAAAVAEARAPLVEALETTRHYLAETPRYMTRSGANLEYIGQDEVLAVIAAALLAKETP